mmetsp:Transcript_26002/g.39296  ORF Transcript_26002/g.39296 Transcript_26002/m.39296 type:complete len:370 (-) Transcript_26002:418-1527(-)
MEKNRRVADRCQQTNVVQILKVRLVGSRLVLGDTVDERVSRFGVTDEQTTDAAAQRTKVTGGCHNGDRDYQKEQTDAGDQQTQFPRLGAGKVLLFANDFRQLQTLVSQKDETRSELFQTFQWRPADDRNLYRQKRSNQIKQRVGGINLVRKTSHQYQQQRVDTDHVQHKDIAAPRRHHVKVRESRSDAPDYRREKRIVSAQRSDPAVEGYRHGRHGDTLVVVTATDAPHEMRRNDTHDSHGDQSTLQSGRRANRNASYVQHGRTGRTDRLTRATVLQKIHQHIVRIQRTVLRKRTLVRQQSGDNGGNRTKPGGDHATNVIDAHVSQQKFFEIHGRKLHSWINGRSDRTSQRIPNHVIEPSEEFFHAVRV